MQPILPATVPVKKIKGAARQSNVGTIGVNRPYGVFTLSDTENETDTETDGISKSSQWD